MDTHHVFGNAILLVCAGLLLTRAQAAELIVLETNSSQYQAGQALDSTAPLTLSDEQFLVLASEDGMLRRIEGPHVGLPGDAGERPSESSLRRAIAQLLGATSSEPGRLGGTRTLELAGAPSDTRPQPWLIHAEQSGNQCVLRDGDVELWREETTDDVRAEVVEVTSGRSAELRWAGSAATASWPFDTAPADNGIYLVRPVNEIKSVPIKVHTLAPELADQGWSTVAWLAARGCVQQARLVLGTVTNGG